MLLQAKSAAVAGTGIVVAKVFFAPVFAIPVMAILGATGAFYTLFALWLLLKKRWPRREQSAA